MKKKNHEKMSWKSRIAVLVARSKQRILSLKCLRRVINGNKKNLKNVKLKCKNHVENKISKCHCVLVMQFINFIIVRSCLKISQIHKLPNQQKEFN